MVMDREPRMVFGIVDDILVCWMIMVVRLCLMFLLGQCAWNNHVLLIDVFGGCQ